MIDFKSRLIRLFTPSAFKLGFLLTAFCVYLAAIFYEVHSSKEIKEVLDRAHQLSFDFRLKLRGPIEPGHEVALITVDEESLEKLGRWPWPRSTIADMIERLRGYGASVVGFDAVFSEPENIHLVGQLESIGNQADPRTRAKIDATIESLNTDLKLARTIERNSEHLVMGAYWDYPNNMGIRPYKEACVQLIVVNTPEYMMVENDERPLIAIDTALETTPEFLISLTQEKLNGIKEKIEEEFGETKSAQEEVERRSAILKAQEEYCGDWLEEDDVLLDVIETNWAALQESMEELHPFTATAYIETFKDSFLPNSVLRTGRWWTNTPVMMQGTRFTGYFNAIIDSDGTLRKTPLITRWGHLYLTSIALKSMMIHRNLGAMATLVIDPVSGKKVVSELALTDLETNEVVETIPVDSSGFLTINYSGGSYTYPHMSVSQLFNGKETATVSVMKKGIFQNLEVNKSEFIKGKVFLFGATATGIYDLRVTPFAENFHGLETHANILDSLLNKRFIRTDKVFEEQAMFAGLIIGGLGLSYVLANLGAAMGLAIATLTFFSYFLFDRFFLFERGIFANLVIPLFMITFLYVSLTFYKYLTEERKKKELKGTFEKYVSPSVVNEILKDPTNLELGGKKARMSVIFSDIRSFTTISEKLDPQVLGDFLNEYLTPMTHLVFDNKGTLDKYMGDAIMAFFGAPIHYPEHAKMACKCALAMMEKLKVLNQNFESKGYPQIDIGIGINTGEMSVGNMGSDIVRSYTVMGDAVNLGSRLEGINKEYGTNIIISEFTFQEVEKDFITREVDWVRVKGKNEPVKIYELIAEKSQPEQRAEVIQLFKEGFSEYHSRRFEKAQICFSKAVELDPNDSPSKLYIQRCNDYLKIPPPDNWDGVFEMKTK